MVFMDFVVQTIVCWGGEGGDFNVVKFLSKKLMVRKKLKE